MKKKFTFYSLYSDTAKNLTLDENSVRGPDQKTAPSESVIRNLINYSKALSVFKTRQSGIINLVMN